MGNIKHKFRIWKNNKKIMWWLLIFIRLTSYNFESKTKPRGGKTEDFSDVSQSSLEKRRKTDWLLSFDADIHILKCHWRKKISRTGTCCSWGLVEPEPTSVTFCDAQICTTVVDVCHTASRRHATGSPTASQPRFICGERDPATLNTWGYVVRSLSYSWLAWSK